MIIRFTSASAVLPQHSSLYISRSEPHDRNVTTSKLSSAGWQLFFSPSSWAGVTQGLLRHPGCGLSPRAGAGRASATAGKHGYYLTYYLSEESQVFSVGDTSISGVKAVGPAAEEAADVVGPGRSGSGPPPPAGGSWGGCLREHSRASGQARLSPPLLARSWRGERPCRARARAGFLSPPTLPGERRSEAKREEALATRCSLTPGRRKPRPFDGAPGRGRARTASPHATTEPSYRNRQAATTPPPPPPPRPAGDCSFPQAEQRRRVRTTPPAMPHGSTPQRGGLRWGRALRAGEESLSPHPRVWWCCRRKTPHGGPTGQEEGRRAEVGESRRQRSPPTQRDLCPRPGCAAREGLE